MKMLHVHFYCPIVYMYLKSAVFELAGPSGHYLSQSGVCGMM